MKTWKVLFQGKCYIVKADYLGIYSVQGDSYFYFERKKGDVNLETLAYFPVKDTAVIREVEDEPVLVVEI